MWGTFETYIQYTCYFVARLAVYSKVLNVPSAFVLHLTAPNLYKKTIFGFLSFPETSSVLKRELQD